MKFLRPICLLAFLTGVFAHADVSCHAIDGGKIVAIPLASTDTGHVYFSGHNGANVFDATYHTNEKFIYMQIATGSSASSPIVSGTFLLNGVGLPATLTYKAGASTLEFICQN